MSGTNIYSSGNNRSGISAPPAWAEDLSARTTSAGIMHSVNIMLMNWKATHWFSLRGSKDQISMNGPTKPNSLMDFNLRGEKLQGKVIFHLPEEMKNLPFPTDLEDFHIQIQK